MKEKSKERICYLKNHEIDKVLWDECICQSPNALIYGHSWFLDATTENWDALVMGNYEVVMPLPWKSKYGLKYIYKPVFVQRLGVFAKNRSIEDESAFLSSVPKHFVKVDYLTSEKPANSTFIKKYKAKTNFVIDLQNEYSTTFIQFKDALRRNIKFAEKMGCSIEKQGVDHIHLLIEMFKSAYEKFYKDLDDQVYVRLAKLATIAIAKQHGAIYAVKLPTNQVVAMYFILKDEKRVYYLFGAPAEEGKNVKAIPYLINEIIKEFANKPLLFDFEGSEIASVADFYKKFNPKIDEYYLVRFYSFLGMKIF